MKAQGIEESKAEPPKKKKPKKQVVPDHDSDDDSDVDGESVDELSDSSDEDSMDEIPSDIDTSELDELEADEHARDHQQGFVYAHDLDTYRMTKREKKDAMVDNPKEKKKFLSSAAKRREKSNSGTTNVEKLKNKPMAMLLPKKAKKRADKRDGKLRVIRKSDLKQLGHFKKNQKQRIDSKKARV